MHQPLSHQTTGKRPHRSRKPPNRLSKKKIGPAGPTTLPPTTRNTIFAPVLRATAPKLTANPWCWLGPRSFLSKLLPKKLSPFICFTILVDCDCYTSIIYTLFKTKISYTARLWVVFLHGQDELLRAISLRADLLSEGGGGGSAMRGPSLYSPGACWRGTF